jgi:alpha-D-xyloside xylohydrolase
MLCKISKFFLLMSLLPAFCHGQVLKDFVQLNDQVNVTLPEGTRSIRPLTENAVRVKFYKEPEPSVPELFFTSSVPTPVFQVADLPSKIEIKMKYMMVVLDKQTGYLSFVDNTGKIFLSEKAGSRKLIPDSVMDEPCFVAEQSYESPNGEYLCPILWGAVSLYSTILPKQRVDLLILTISG